MGGLPSFIYKTAFLYWYRDAAQTAAPLKEMIVDFLSYFVRVLRRGHLELFPDDESNILHDYTSRRLENVADFIDFKLIKWVKVQNRSKKGWLRKLRVFCLCGLVVMACILFFSFWY
jgi:hypothetical protein